MMNFDEEMNVGIVLDLAHAQAKEKKFRKTAVVSGFRDSGSFPRGDCHDEEW
jgi:hypothetical protein